MEDIFNAEHGIYLNDINLGEGTFIDQLGTITCLDEIGDPIVLNLVDGFHQLFNRFFAILIKIRRCKYTKKVCKNKA